MIATKPFYLLLLSCALLSFATAQERWTFSVSSGRSFPVGKFGGKNLNDSTNSFARPGPAAKITAAYNFSHMFSLMVAFAGQENPVDVASMGRQLEQKLPNTEIGLTSHNWWIWKLMAGPNVNFPLDKSVKCILSVRALAGILKTGVPEFAMQTRSLVDSTGGYSTYSMTTKRPLNSVFVYDIGAGFSYHFTKHFAVLADLDYSSAQAKFYRSFYSLSNLQVITGTGTVVLPTTSPTVPKQTIASVNFLLGVSISL